MLGAHSFNLRRKQTFKLFELQSQLDAKLGFRV